MYKILFLEIFSIGVMIYGIFSRIDLKKKMNKMGSKRFFWQATLWEIDAIIMIGILGIVGGVVFFIRLVL